MSHGRKTPKIKVCHVFVCRENKHNGERQTYYVTGSEGRNRKYPFDIEQLKKEVLDGDKVSDVMIRIGKPWIENLRGQVITEIEI